MKSSIIFWVTLILLFLTIVALVLKNGWTKYVESMRVAPRPTVAPQVEYAPPPDAVVPIRRNVGGLNEDVDSLIGQYFDKNLVPYRDTIALYYEYFVNKGNLNPELKKKIKDICYYIIEVVIPNIPSIDNPTPDIKWTRIEWLANNWNAYNYSFNFDALANLDLLAKLRSAYGGDGGIESGIAGEDGTFGTEGTGNTGGSNAPGASGITSTPSPASNKTGPGNAGNKQSNCNMACPTACNFSENAASAANSPGGSPLAQAAAAANTPDWLSNMSDKPLGNRGTRGSSGSDGLPGTSSLGTFKKSGGSNGEVIVYEVLVTKETNKFPESQTLNNYVKTQIIDKWFDTVENADSPLPSKYAQSMFDLYTNGRSPIDRHHKNKLRDFVYYYMENIIPGLPTKDKPVSYVEWRPLRLLANSDL